MGQEKRQGESMDSEKGQAVTNGGARENRASAWIPAAWALTVVAADQATKAAARSLLQQGSPVEIVPGMLNLTLVFNEGAAWGMLGGFRVLFVILALAMLALMNVRWRRLFCGSRLGTVSFALLEGGIVGNVIDRLLAGRVTDFLDFYHGAWHFPCFNIADSAICIGVALFFLHSSKAPGGN